MFAWRPVTQRPAQDQSADWQQPFNGEDLIGWKHVGRGKDAVENSLIRTQGGSGVLYGPKTNSKAASSAWCTRCATTTEGPESFSRGPVEGGDGSWVELVGDEAILQAIWKVADRLLPLGRSGRTSHRTRGRPRLRGCLAQRCGGTGNDELAVPFVGLKSSTPFSRCVSLSLWENN